MRVCGEMYDGIHDRIYDSEGFPYFVEVDTIDAKTLEQEWFMMSPPVLLVMLGGSYAYA